MHSPDPKAPDPGRPAGAPELTVIVVSYNTRDLTLACLRALHAGTRTPFRCILWDNASSDGSAEAVAAAFPDVTLVRSPENVGFAAANNRAAGMAQTEWLLLLNPDTEVEDGAVDRLLAFSRQHPEAGITGGRTVFPDGSLNPSSCWMRPTLWSVFCQSSGLTRAFRGSSFLNPEAMGAWQRDTVRQVDIVVGCFMMLPRALWDALGGFDTSYFMYGEESDLCLRAARRGYRPMVTPDAQIMHLVGGTIGRHSVRKRMLVTKARITLIRRHWPRWQVPLGVGMIRAGIWARLVASRGRAPWPEIWATRADWTAGY